MRHALVCIHKGAGKVVGGVALQGGTGARKWAQLEVTKKAQIQMGKLCVQARPMGRQS